MHGRLRSTVGDHLVEKICKERWKGGSCEMKLKREKTKGEDLSRYRSTARSDFAR